MTPLVFLDTETTGVHPGRQAWEIAMIRRDDHGREDSHFFVEVDLSAADPFGLSIGRFYERHPQGHYLSGRISVLPNSVNSPGLLEQRTAAHEVAKATHGAHIVGAVPNFDTEVLAQLLRTHGLIPSWHYHLVDVENLAVGYLAAKGEPLQPPWNSDDLTAALGLAAVPERERHTAIGDALWAMRIYDTVMGNDQ
jgi:hypothetical protein